MRGENAVLSSWSFIVFFSLKTQVPFGLCHVILHSVFADRFRMKPQWLDDAANARGSIVARERMQGLVLPLNFLCGELTLVSLSAIPIDFCGPLRQH